MFSTEKMIRKRERTVTVKKSILIIQHITQKYDILLYKL